MDTTAAIAAIAAMSTPISAVGAAVFLVLVGIKTIKWIRRAL